VRKRGPTTSTSATRSGCSSSQDGCFSEGERGAHQVVNRTDEAVRVLILSTLRVPAISHYPDSDKLGARSSRDEAVLFRRRDAIEDYWDGE
jgi:uncharacterized cupin superfamily protein